MAYRNIKDNEPLFDCIGLSQNRFRLPTITRRMLGFLIINAVDSYIDALIGDAYIHELPDAPKDVSVEEMLQYLSQHPSNIYSGRTDDQIVIDIILKAAEQYDKYLELLIETEKGRRDLRRLLERTKLAEKNGTLVDEE